MKGILFLLALGLCHGSTYVLERREVEPIHFAELDQLVPRLAEAFRAFNNAEKENTKSLNDLLSQLLEFIPVDQIIEVVKRYMANDPDVKQAWEFLQSEEFHKLIDTVRSMPEYKDFVKFLMDAGFDLYKWLNLLRAAFGLPPIEPPTYRLAQVKESGIIVMVKEILTLLPVDDIKNWYHTVCEPDPEYQAFLAKLKSPEFLKIVLAVYNSPQYKELTDIMLAQGIDVAAIEEVIRNFFNSARSTRASLDDLLNQLIEFIPVDQIIEVVKRYMANDPDVKQAWEFLQSDEFHKLIDTVRSMQEYKDFVKFLMDAGFDLYKWLNLLRSAFGLPPIEPPTYRLAQVKESGIIVMVKEILTLLPVDDIKNWYNTVCKPDPHFQAFLAKLKSPEFLKIVLAVYNSPQYKELTDIMLAQGIDVAAIEEVIRNFFNSARSTRASLDDLLNQLIEFIPVDQIIEVVKRYMANDPDVKQAWEFLQSDEFHKLIDTVRSMQEYKDFVKFLMDAGFDLYKWLNLLRSAFGLPPIEPPTYRLAQVKESGIIVMVKEILTLLPVDDIKNWYNTVCKPDPNFQAFLAKLKSPEFLKIVLAVYNSPQYKELTDIMLAQGIDVAAIEEVIRNFFNSARSTRASLDDLLNQLIEFIPVDQIIEVVKRYMANDPDVKQAWEFLQSDEFHKLIDTVRSMQEYKDFVKFLMDAGFDLYKWLNLLRAAFGLPPIEPPTYRLAQVKESGIIVMVKEILTLLPVDDIKNWYNTVCKPDPNFQAFLAKIKSPEFLKIVLAVYNSPQYKELTDIMLAQGIDVAAIEEVIRNFFNSARSTRASLDDLLNQLIEFIPVDQIIEVVKRYMANDPDVKQAWEFLQSDEFHKLIDTVRSMQEYKDFVKFLMDAGFDLYKWLNLLRAAFGLPPIEPPTYRLAQVKESGIIVMVKEILTLLPVDDIKNWYNTVCKPDPNFQAFLAKIKSPEFLKIVLAVYNSPQYKELTDIMLAQGIDVAAIEEVIRNFFNSARSTRASLDDLLNQLIEFIPVDQIIEVVKRYMANDPDVKQAWEFLQSDEFHKLIDTVRSMQEYKDFVKFLMDAGFDLYKWLNLLRSAFGLPPIEPPTYRLAQVKESGIIVMVKEILTLLPVDDIKNWYNTVCKPDPNFQAFLAKLKSPEFLKIVLAVYNSPQYKELTDIMLAQGIDVAAIEEVIRNFFNSARSTRASLDELFNQFLEFIPFDQIVEVVKRYMVNDPDVKQAWEFLQSDEFHKIIDAVRAMQEYKDFVKYLLDAGYDLYKYLNLIRAAFGLPPIVPPTYRLAHVKESGIIVMVKEILTLLPVDDIKNWYRTVCEPDPVFQAFLAKLKSPEFLKIVLAVYNSPQYKELTDIMLAQGIDVAAIEEVIRNFFNSARNTRASLDELFNQFLEFIPFDQIVEVVKRYMVNDPDVKQAWEFLQSDEFHKIIDAVRAMQEYKDFVKYLLDAGYDLYKYLNLIRAAFGLPPIVPPTYRLAHVKESGIIVMVKEILTLLPVDDIKNWYRTVCEPDPVFQAFLAKLKSPEFLKIVLAVYNSPQYKELTDIMLAQGIDVAAIEEVIRNFFNSARNTRASLDELFNQFLEFIPFDQIVEVVKRYMVNDPDVKQAWEFLQSDEFHKIIDAVRAMPEYKDFVKYLLDAGYDLYKYLNLIRAAFGLPPIVPPKYRNMRESGIIVMVKEILTLLPVDDIKNWYRTVCEPDPVFQAFLAKLKSPEFLKIVLAVYNSPQYKELTDIMLAQGIDVAAIEEVIRNFFNGTRMMY